VLSRERRAAAGTPKRLQVVLFSGGRGSGVLARQLVSNPAVSVTLAINGYDDGASTGEVRRLLGDSLGPSDFRKNASRLAAELATSAPALIDLLDRRLPEGASAEEARQALAQVGTAPHVPADRLAVVTAALSRFAEELDTTRRPFDFHDCSVGNLVFAGLYLEAGRAFNAAVDRYTALLGLPEGLIENVTGGENAWLVGIDHDGRLLATEEAIVDQARPNRIKDIFLIDRPLAPGEAEAAIGGGGLEALLAARSARVSMNDRLRPKIAAADLIIYAPGTQHSSLFPSYLTPGMNAAIAGNLAAIKLLITNIQADAEITGSNAVDLIGRAVYYLKERGRLSTPTPCLITHYLVNEPGHAEPATPYVPLGPLDAVEDPRLVRIGNYEAGISGRHDATRVLAPFLDAILARETRRAVAVLLHDAGGSLDKITESLLEMIRGGADRLPLDITVFYGSPAALDRAFVESLPFDVVHLAGGEGTFTASAAAGRFDYVALFESSGMYRGEDLAALLTHLPSGRLDAVWGSRRLSVRDIEESYRFRYRRNALLGATSYIGSYVLSLACLLFYGRYISDTLSAVRAVRAGFVFAPGIDVASANANHVILSSLLRSKADVLEIPVRFVPLSPERVKRTTPMDGLRALASIVAGRFRKAMV
jgi:2-phospho-L-lactate transferase/gluconeogenesis factor (CofD/UPF0052 family)